MKTKAKHASVRVIAMVLGVVILITSLGLASLITVGAYSKLTFYYKIGTGSWTSQEVDLSSNVGTISVEVPANTTMESAIKTDNNEWYGNQSLAPNSERNLATLSSNYNYNGGSNNNKFTPTTGATYTFTLNMGTKKISVDGGTGGSGGGGSSTASSYSIVGRFQVRDASGNTINTGPDETDAGWDEDSTNIKFENTEDENVFVLHTHSTLAQLAANRANNVSMFAIYDGSEYYHPYNSAGNTLIEEENTEYSFYDDNQTSYRRDDNSPDKRSFKFKGTDTTHFVDIYIEKPTTGNTYKLYYKLVDIPYTYYIEGRFGFDWDDDTKDHPFETTDTEGLYVYHSQLTPSELKANRQSTKQYFFVGRAIEKGNVTNWYQPANKTGLIASDAGSAKSVSLNSTRADLFFNINFDDDAHYVDVYFDIINSSSPKIYFTLVEPDYHYYLEGRFETRDVEGNKTTMATWTNTNKTNFRFAETTTPGLYVLNTYSTLAQLSADISGGDNGKTPYFRVGRQMGNRDINLLYKPTEDGATLEENEAGDNQALASSTSLDDGNSFKFVTSENPNFVNIYFDITDSSAPKLYFELVKPVYNYYIEGRMEVYTTSARSTTSSINWKHDSKTLKFESTATSGLYKLDTFKTVSELTAQFSSADQYFVLGRGTLGNTPDKYFRPFSDKTLKASDANKKFEGEWTGSWTNFSGYHYKFSDTTSENADALVTFYYNENTDQFYFTLTPAEYDTTIYVINNVGSAWGEIAIYTWYSGNESDANKKAFGAWSGLTFTNGKFSYGNYSIVKTGTNAYTLKFNRKGGDKVIFNNTGTGGDKQTNTLNLVNGQTYIINSATESGTNNRTVTIADGQIVNFIAKDGMVRDNTHKSFAEYATTAVTAVANQVSVNTATTAFDNTKYVTGWATKGHDITVKTTISDTYKDKYYVAGFSFNGETPEELTENSTGVYECTYTIPEDFAYDTLEITPIFFLKKAYSNYYVTFNISGYESVKNEGWGSTLYIYPFYASSSQAFNYGAYPGQPVINYGGQFYTQIPTTDDGTSSGNIIKGVTINNGYWDLQHRTAEGWAVDDSNHHQTYDFDDFYKLYKENGTDLNSVYFTFKYEEAEAHRTTIPTNSTSAWTTYRNDDIPATLTQAQMDAYAAKNGFDDYINSNGKKIDLFGSVLSGANLTADPIYVISQGYEYNNSGCFATEWDVFYWDSANNRYQKVTVSGNTSIVPSALHIKNYQDIATNYPETDGDLPISTYEGIYRELEKYSDRPVKICYEKDIKAGYYHRKNGNAGNDQAYRCDGVWSYTLKTDFVAANTLIQYSDDNGASWNEDPFNGTSAAGISTKCKAYFTYKSDDKNGYGSAFDGKTSISDVYVDDSKYFTFQAEGAGQYEFVGWTLRDAAGNETAIKADSNNAGETKMSTTVTLIARFKKVSSGNIIISHTLDQSSEGLGTTYLGIRILNNSDAVIDTIANEETNTTEKTIGKQYITSDSENKIQVTLKTVINGENTFNKFQLSKDGAQNVNSDATYLPAGTPTTSGNVVTKTITFPISGLFTSSNQNLTALSYYSLLNETLNKYDVTFTYSDRNNASKSMRVKGTFTPGQLKAYVTGTGKNKTVAKNFFSEIKPNVSNFKTDIEFNFNSVTPVWSDLTDGAYTMTATVNAKMNPSLARTATFVTPFDMTNFIADESSAHPGTYEYVADAVESAPLAVEYGKLIKVKNGSFDVDNGNFVTAPKTLVDYDNNTTYYFKCWNIKTTSGAAVASCYYPEFNYLTYDNCIVEAEYTTDQKYYYQFFNEAQGTTTTFLKNTRTQWNVDGEGDLIYSDFALSFKYGDVKFYEDGWSNKYEIGVIMQRLDPVEMDSDGKHTKTLAQYASKYSGSLDTATASLETMLKNGTAAPTGTRKTAFTYNKLDNKNRLEYYVGQYNSKTWDEENQKWIYSEWDKDNDNWTEGTGLNTNSKYVYRLFTYIFDKTKKEVIISDPTYFYMYNTVNDKVSQ